MELLRYDWIKNVMIGSITTVENGGLIESMKQLTNDANLLGAENTKLKETMEVLNHEMQVMKVNLQTKEDKVDHLEEMLMGVQQELSLTRLELEQLKSDPSSHLSKGNSLFGEVEDRRRKVEKRMSTMQSQYKYLKRENSNKCKEISKLRCDNIILCNDWEEIKKEVTIHKQQFKTAYEEQIKELLQQMKRLKEPLVRVVCEETSLHWMQAMLEERNNTIESLHRQLGEKSFAHLLSVELLHKAQQDLICSKADHKLSQAKIMTLENRISHNTDNLQDNAEPSANLPESEGKARSETHFVDNGNDSECQGDVKHSKDTQIGKVTSEGTKKDCTKLSILAVKRAAVSKIIKFAPEVLEEPETKVKLQRCKQQSYPTVYIPPSNKPL